MNASRPDTILVEREAARVAAQAASALRDSRKQAQKAKLGTPTWTGRFGSAGKSSKLALNKVPSRPSSRSSTPSGRSSPGVSSSSVLESLRHKRQLEQEARSSSPLASSFLGEKSAAAAAVLTKMRDFLSKQPNHMAKSADILSSSGVRLEGVQEVANVRQMLKQIAVWQNEHSMWQLKEDFQ